MDASIVEYKIEFILSFTKRDKIREMMESIRTWHRYDNSYPTIPQEMLINQFYSHYLKKAKEQNEATTMVESK